MKKALYIASQLPINQRIMTVTTQPAVVNKSLYSEVRNYNGTFFCHQHDKCTHCVGECQFLGCGGDETGKNNLKAKCCSCFANVCTWFVDNRLFQENMSTHCSIYRFCLHIFQFCFLIFLGISSTMIGIGGAHLSGKIVLHIHGKYLVRVMKQATTA